MIVKKCPAYYNNLGCMSNKMFFKSCEEENNCLMKEIVKTLKYFNKNTIVNKILTELEIQ